MGIISMIENFEKDERLEIVKRLSASTVLKELDNILTQELKKVVKKEYELVQLIKTAFSIHGYKKCFVDVLPKSELAKRKILFAIRVTKEFEVYKVLYRLARQNLPAFDWYAFGKRQTKYLVVYLDERVKELEYEEEEMITVARVEVAKANHYSTPTFS